MIQQPLKIINVVGARPNFMKIGPLMRVYRAYASIHPFLVHTGQHYEKEMSDLFFQELDIPAPDIHLDVGSASHAVQTAEIMRRFEPVLSDLTPDLVLVVGDVNSTIACALTAAKWAIPIAHVEAGLRSFDRAMPEEINRVLTDALSDCLFTTERGAGENLQREGIPAEKTFFVGNVMVDTLLRYLQKAKASSILNCLGLEDAGAPFAVLTLHRPSNVDDSKIFKRLLEAIETISKELLILFPAHPRTKKKILDLGWGDYFKTDIPIPSQQKGIYLLDPLGYLDFIHLVSRSKMLLTDSGGVQEETTVLGIPCLTLRENTERPITVTQGTNIIVGTDPDRILSEARNVLEGRQRQKRLPELWDGEAAVRIVEILAKRYGKI